MINNDNIYAKFRYFVNRNNLFSKFVYLTKEWPIGRREFLWNQLIKSCVENDNFGDYLNFIIDILGSGDLYLVHAAQNMLKLAINNKVFEITKSTMVHILTSVFFKTYKQHKNDKDMGGYIYFCIAALFNTR